MERVNKGEEYWFIDKDGEILCRYESYSCQDDMMFNYNNYFHTREEAKPMAEKFCKVLKGADVIEMPSEKECEEESNKQRQNYNPMPDEADYVGGFGDAIEFLRSKIVK